ncbi:hypothetical protein [Cohnella sp. GCM10027633]|uniref:hypothetical protein n=1 Tax=unclassified Cohnella TaxID=2636738 RepID=UPI0036307387
MYFVQTQEITPSKHRVHAIHYLHEGLEHNVPVDEVGQGFAVSVMPQPDSSIIDLGNMGELFINPQDLSMWYEYIPRPKTEREMLEVANSEIQLLQSKLSHAEQVTLETIATQEKLIEKLVQLGVIW